MIYHQLYSVSQLYEILKMSFIRRIMRVFAVSLKLKLRKQFVKNLFLVSNSLIATMSIKFMG